MAPRQEHGSASDRVRVVLLCLLAQNLAMGVAYGSFGPLLASMEAQFGISRAVGALGMSCITLAIAVSSPLAAASLRFVEIRTVMIAGALMSAVGYGGLAASSRFELALVMFALVGAGVATLAILGPLTLVNRWFPHRRGRVLGRVNLPLAIIALPVVVVTMLPILGRPALLAAFALLFLLLMGLLFLLPGDADEHPSAADAASDTKRPSGTPSSRERNFTQLAAMPSLWLLSLGVALVSGSATAFVVHGPLFGESRLLSPAAASALLTVYALMGVLGSLISGILADRIGPLPTLCLTSVLLALLWFALSQASGPLLFPIAAALGFFTVPWITLHGAALATLVNPASVSRAVAISYVIKLPFVFAFPPLVGAMSDISGSYALAFVGVAGALVLAALLFLVAARPRSFDSAASLRSMPAEIKGFDKNLQSGR